MVYKVLKIRKYVTDILMESTCPKKLISIDTFITISYIKKIVFLVMFLIQSSHSSASRRNYIIDKEK